MKKLLSYCKNIKFIYKNTKGLFYVSLILFIVGGILPYINVSAIAGIVNTTEDAIKANSSVFNTNLFYYMIILAISILSERLLMLSNMPLSTVMNYRINTKINLMIVEKSAVMEYSNLENTEYQTRLQNVRKFSGSLPQLLDLSLAFLKSLITILTLLVKFSGNYYICLIILIGLIPSIIISSKQKQMQYKLEKRLTSKQRIRDYYSMLLSNSSYIKEKYIYNLKNTFTEKWTDVDAEINSEYLKLQYKAVWLNFLSDMVTIATYVLVISMLLFSDFITASLFISLSSAIIYLQGAFSNSFSCITSIKQSLVDINFVEEFFNDDTYEHDGDKILEKPIDSIIFSNVSFSYNDNNIAIKNMSFEIKRGETIAIIGENGAGKTTLLKLMLGIYTPQQGIVLCNGIDIKKLKKNNYFMKFACIFQNFNQYPFTIQQNIDVFTEENMTPSENIIKIAKKLNILNWIESLKDKFNTLLTHMRSNGIELSGGQWQKIAIARALKRKADVLIMDEPTSSLDPLNEKMVFDEFISESESTIKIVVSHRVGITSKADKILFIRNGELIECGNHESLIHNKGAYAKLYNTQAEWYSVD